MPKIPVPEDDNKQDISKTVAPPPPSVQDEEGIEKVKEEEIVSSLPPLIVTNARGKIEPKHVSQSALSIYKQKRTIINAALIWCNMTEKKKPIPKHPLSLSWWPAELTFRLENEPVQQILHVINRSPKIMYIHCCGLWEKNAQLGASWQYSPHTRLLLAPGLEAQFRIRAKPREESPVSYARLGLQLATCHCKDIVIGYFVVPILVFFGNFNMPQMVGEIEEEEEA